MIFRTEDDLDLRAISESGQTFRWEDLGGGSWRIFSAADCLYVRELGDGRFDLDCGEEEFRSVWHDYFDLSEDYASLREKIDPTEDLFLYEAARYGKGIRILRQDPWEMLITFIISQNKNIPAIKKSIEMLSEMAGERKTDRRGETYYAFPTPQRIAGLSGQELSACRLGYRCKYVRAAAEAVLSGSLDLGKLIAAGDEEALAALKGVYGVGTKVANCVLLFGLHHLNAFPVDVWIKKVLEEQYPSGYPYEEYSPWNGIYQQYMFAYYRNGYILTV
jgi:N-glycosylase/DNA lyase